ncbi:MAG: DNA-binding protein WhiA [Candidatus Dormiibacterota bacterium]
MAAQGRASFTADVRHELALLAQPRACCQLSELKGFAAAARVRDDAAVLSIRLTSNAAARKVVRLGRSLRGDGEQGAHAGHFQRGRTHVRPSYDVGIERGGPLVELTPAAALPASACCRRAYLRGAFTAAGVASIGPGGSHLEFGMTGRRGADNVAAAVRSLGLRPRTRRRGARWMVYVKGSDDVTTLLKAMGASQGVLRFENDRILRELRGQANRQANSETANLRRSVATGLRQVAEVRRLMESRVLDDQPVALREVAGTRLAMPSATLGQMAERMGLSKSAVNARLRRLSAVAQEAGLIN